MLRLLSENPVHFPQCHQGKMRTFKSQTRVFFTMHRSPEIFSMSIVLATYSLSPSQLARTNSAWRSSESGLTTEFTASERKSRVPLLTDNSLSSENRLTVRASLLIEQRLKVARFLLRHEKVEGQPAAFAHIHHYYCYCHYVSDLSGNLRGWKKECQKPTPKASESPQTPILM